MNVLELAGILIGVTVIIVVLLALAVPWIWHLWNWYDTWVNGRFR